MKTKIEWTDYSWNLEQCKEFNKPFFFKQRGNFYDLKNKENKLEAWERKIMDCKEFPKM